MHRQQYGTLMIVLKFLLPNNSTTHRGSAPPHKPSYPESPNSRFKGIYREMTIRVTQILEYMMRQQLEHNQGKHMQHQ